MAKTKAVQQDEIGTTPLNKIIEWPDNPRKTRDDAAVDEVGRSILARGQMLPLVLFPVENSDLFYAIDGETRRQGMNGNATAGKCAADMPVKSIVLDASTKPADLLAIALTLNAVRRQMSPIEEMEAITEMVRRGLKPPEIGNMFNLTAKQVMQRLKLGHLVVGARDLVRSATRSMRWAEAMTIGSPAGQEKILGEIAANANAYIDASSVYAELRRGTIPLESALFDPNELKDSVVRNLFSAIDGSGHFTDVAAFWKKQDEAIQNKIDELAKTYGPRVEYFNRRRFNDAGWSTGGDPETAWAVVVSHDDGSVQIREGMVRPNFDINAQAESTEGDWLNGGDDSFQNDLDAQEAPVAKIETNPLDNATSGTTTYLNALIVAGLRLKAASDPRVAMALVIASSLTRHGGLASPMSIAGNTLDEKERTASVFQSLATRQAARQKIAEEAGIVGVTSPSRIVSNVLALNDQALNDLFAWTVSESISAPMDETTFEVYDALGLEVLSGWRIEETYLETLNNAQLRALAGEIVEVASQPSKSAAVPVVKKAILAQVETDALQGNWVGATSPWQPPQVARLSAAVALRRQQEEDAATAAATAAAAIAA